ncbi:MAG: AAA family ATPase [Ginsengibacter sp.]
MDKIRLKKFKAFEGEVVIPLNNNKNLLLYGENGSGKTSIYESLKIAFFRDKIEAQISAQTPEDLQQLKNELWSSFNNKINNQGFEIQINDRDYKSFTISDYQVFLISIEELVINDSLNFKTLLNRFCFSIDVESLCQNHCKDVQEDVNLALNEFNESVSIEIDEEDDYAIKICDTKKNIDRKSDLKKYFNEAKLNLIILLILFSSIIRAKNSQKNQLLALDDFITSLDSSNRTFLIKYLFEKFKNTQILIFTHNISFYNLVKYFVYEIEDADDKWAFANIFEINNVHKIYIKSEIERVKVIKEDFNALANSPTDENVEGIGNRIRKKFEILLYEYSKLLMIGTVEDSNKILNRIMNSNAAYYNGKNTASNLIDEIKTILDENNPHNLIERLQARIEKYSNSDFNNFQTILKGLKIYQKVTMHPMSHGVIGMPAFTIKEIEKSISLLEKMEDYLKELVDNNVVNI